MKKILALVLALVMTMSMATISSGAAFSDADKVQYVDAVNTLNALGVLGGYADGSIRPAADVTRGAAAKMVAMVATGSNATTIGYYKGTSSFSDVPATHTFADAVAFCVARGIVEGYGNGLYGVADNVKGWAVAKMVLVAMGYDADAYGLSGKGAALNTITLASQKGLFAGMAADFNANEAASREECAQIVYNALTKTGVAKGAVNSDGSYTYYGTSTTLLDNYNIQVDTAQDGTPVYANLQYGVVVANAATGAAATTLDTGVTLTNETGLDLIGHKVLYVDTKAPAVEGAKTAYAVVDLSKVVTVSAAEAAEMDTEKEFVAKFGDKTVAEGVGYMSFTDYTKDTTASDKTGTYTAAAGTYVVADKKIVSYLTGTTKVGYVSSYAAGSAVANGTLAVKVDNSATGYTWTLVTKTGDTNPTLVSFYEGLAKDDIVLVNKTGSLYTLTKAATVSGVVSAVDVASGYESITIGGKAYAKSANFVDAATDVLATGDVVAFSSAAVNKDVVAYVDANGAVFAMVEAAGATATDAGLVYVVAKYSAAGAANAYGQAGATTYYVQGVDMEGKEVSYQVTKSTYNGLAVPSAAGNAATDEVALYKASVSYNDTLKANVATFSAADDANGAWLIESAAIDATALKVGTNHYFASDVKTIYVSGKLDTLKTEVKAGAQTAGSADYYAVKAGSNYEVKYIVVDGTPGTTVSSTDVVYAYGCTSDKTETYTKADGTTGVAYVYSVYINGELKTVKSLDTSMADGFYSYTIDSATGLYDFSSYNTNVVDSKVVTRLYNGLLTVDSLVDANAASAKIVDARYAAAWDKTNLVEITTLDGLFADGTLTNVDATVSVVYSVSGSAKTVVTIYVEAAPSYVAP